MTAFATADDLSARLGITLTPAEQSRATQLIEIASGVIQDAARQRIDLVEDDEITVWPTGTTFLLPERPVVAVISITRDGNSVPANTWTVDDHAITRAGGWASCAGGGPLTVVYTHGYPDNEIPAVVKSVCLEMVVRAWVNPGSVMTERVGNEQATYALQGTPRGLLLTEEERRMVRRAVRRGARSEALA